MKKFLLKNRNRVLFIALLVASLYFVLLVKLWREQIRRAETHRWKISRQSVRRIRIPAPRGKILSSDLQVLADNLPSYDVYLYFEEMRQPQGRSKTVTYIENAILQIDAILNLKKKITAEEIIRHMNTRPGLPFKVAGDIEAHQMAQVFELSAKVKGLGIIPNGKRVYPQHDIGAHLIGYTRPEDPSQASDRKDFFYYLPDLRGVRGIEKQFDAFPFADKPVRGLKGYPGFSLVQVDHRGFIHKTLIDEIIPLSGNNIVLTLDWRAQKIASELLKGRRGAFVLLNADSGAVLALVSSPSFDLQSLSPSITSKEYKKLRDDPENPLFDRAVMGEYTPGSIMKPLVALALLKNGIDPEEKVDCDGKTPIGNTSIRCSSWRSGGHGETNLREALERSCNDYFIEKGNVFEMENYRDIFASAGFGRLTRIGLPERRGKLPEREAKKHSTGFAWNKYDTSLLCIGQGYITITPLQAAVYAAALCNGGTLYQPFLLKEIRSSAGIVLSSSAPRVSGHLDASPEDLKIVQEGMFMVVNSPGGSGKLAATPAIVLSGKTGTAEVKSGGHKSLNTWFICFGEHKGTRYAAAILVEDGISGSRTCAPLARIFFTRYLKNR
jgi:penicillin-binding protein 2